MNIIIQKYIFAVSINGRITLLFEREKAMNIDNNLSHSKKSGTFAQKFET